MVQHVDKYTSTIKALHGHVDKYTSHQGSYYNMLINTQWSQHVDKYTSTIKALIHGTTC